VQHLELVDQVAGDDCTVSGHCRLPNRILDWLTAH
jgi:hypothetical protein